MSLDINSTNYLTVRRLWSILSSFKTKIATALGGKQDTLSTQTAYTSKGSATKVPQITTNTLGQVTGITEVTISGVTPASHATSATTYGIGTTANYGHVKLATGDMNGVSHEDGVAVSKNHTHNQYLNRWKDTSGFFNTTSTTGAMWGKVATVAYPDGLDGNNVIYGRIWMHQYHDTELHADFYIFFPDGRTSECSGNFTTSNIGNIKVGYIIDTTNRTVDIYGYLNGYAYSGIKLEIDKVVRYHGTDVNATITYYSGSSTTTTEPTGIVYSANSIGSAGSLANVAKLVLDNGNIAGNTISMAYSGSAANQDNFKALACFYDPPSGSTDENTGTYHLRDISLLNMHDLIGYGHVITLCEVAATQSNYRWFARLKPYKANGVGMFNLRIDILNSNNPAKASTNESPTVRYSYFCQYKSYKNDSNQNWRLVCHAVSGANTTTDSVDNFEPGMWWCADGDYRYFCVHTGSYGAIVNVTLEHSSGLGSIFELELGDPSKTISGNVQGARRPWDTAVATATGTNPPIPGNITTIGTLPIHMMAYVEGAGSSMSAVGSPSQPVYADRRGKLIAVNNQATGNNLLVSIGDGGDNIWNGDKLIASSHTNNTTDDTAYVHRSTDHLLNFLFRNGTGGYDYADLDSSMRPFGHAYGATISSSAGCYGWKIGTTQCNSGWTSASFKAIAVIWDFNSNHTGSGYGSRNFVGVLDIYHRMDDATVSDANEKYVGMLTSIVPLPTIDSNDQRGFAVFAARDTSTHTITWYLGRNSGSGNMNRKLDYSRMTIFPIQELSFKKFLVQVNSTISVGNDWWGTRGSVAVMWSQYGAIGSTSLPVYIDASKHIQTVNAKNTCTNFLNSLDAATQQDIISDDVYIPTTSRDGTDLTTWYRRKVTGLRAGGGTEKILDIGRTNVSDTNYVNLRWKGSSVGSDFKYFAVFRTAQQSKDGTTPLATISDIPLDEAKKRILHNTYGTAVGSSSLPVYVDSSGNVTAVGSKMELPADSQAWVRVQQTNGATVYLDSESNKGGIWVNNGGTSKWLCYRDSNGASNFGVTTANSYDGIYCDGDTPCYFNGSQIAGGSYQNSSTSHYRWYFGKMTPGTTTTEKHFCGILEVNTIDTTSGAVRGTGFVGIVKIDARQATEFHVNLSIINNNGWPMSTLRPTLIVTDSGNERLFSIAFTNSNNALQAFQYTRFTLTGIGYFKEWVWDRWFSTSSTVTSNDWLWPASYDSDTVDGWHIQVGSVGTRSDTLYFT